MYFSTDSAELNVCSVFERSSALTQAAVKWVVSEAFREMEA